MKQQNLKSLHMDNSIWLTCIRIPLYYYMIFKQINFCNYEYIALVPFVLIFSFICKL